MKTIFYYLLLIAVITAACKPKSIDVNTTTSEIAAQLDKYRDAMNTRDTNALKLLLTEKGLFCGTDPKELLDKKTFMDLSKQSFADTSVNWKYTVNKREIHLAADGNSAMAVDQFKMPGFSAKLTIRLVVYLIKVEDAWKFDFTSASFIPLNEEVEKLNKALE